MRRLRLTLIGLLLAAIPCLGMAAFTPVVPRCPMQTHSDCYKHGHMLCCDESALSDECAQTNQCDHCSMAPSMLTLEFALGDEHAAVHPLISVFTDRINGHGPSGLWRPPRFS